MLLAVLAASPAFGQNQLWVQQFGPATSFARLDVALADGSGGVFIGGRAGGYFPGPPLGDVDGWLARYDQAGNRQWIRQLGTSHSDTLTGAAPDGFGGLFVAGMTISWLPAPWGSPSDYWLARYDSAGNRLWSRQSLTSDSESVSTAASDGSGGVYISGYADGNLGVPNVGGIDALLVRYDSGGNLVWTRQFGTAGYDTVLGSAPDGQGGVYLAGGTAGSLVGQNAGDHDAWLARYDPQGNRVWIRQFGTAAFDVARAAFCDETGGVFVCGRTNGDLAAVSDGHEDAWVARYDSAGERTWIQQLGIGYLARADSVSPDGWGGVYVGGSMNLYLGLLPDPFLAHYDKVGNLTWFREFGSAQEDAAFAAAPDGMGGVFAGGFTYGNLAGGYNPPGICEAWLARYDAGCVPISYCTAKTNSLGCTPTMQATGSASASGSNAFVLSATNVRNQKPGWLLYSLNGQAAAPFGNGTLCLTSPLRRTSAVSSGGNPSGNDCTGVYSLDFNAYVSGAIGGEPHPALQIPGLIFDVQWIGRDQGFSAPDNITLSNAMHFTMCP